MTNKHQFSQLILTWESLSRSPWIDACRQRTFVTCARELQAVLATLSDEELTPRGNEAVRILAAIIDAGDRCQGHRHCDHSMEPWQRARRLLYPAESNDTP